MDQSPSIGHIEQKWGFGMAPVKSATQQSRIESAFAVRSILVGDHPITLEDLERISIVKGMFTRCYKQDQWDWFTVWSQLNFPSHGSARQISTTLKEFHRSIRNGDPVGQKRTEGALLSLNVPGVLGDFTRGTNTRKAGHGFVYILSTREMPKILKIGYTDRDVITRAKEINAATGVIIPFGARAAWIVPQAQRIESEIHSLLARYHLRKDREFFQLEFAEASRIIGSYVDALDSNSR